MDNLTQGLILLSRYLKEVPEISTSEEGLFIITLEYDLAPTERDQELLEQMGWERLSGGYMWKNQERS